MDAYEDFNNTGVLRSVQQGVPEGASLTERAMSRPTSFPSFQKGYADMAYAPKEGAVIFETALPTFKRGEINPVTGLPIKGRHYAHRVIDPKTGATMSEIPAADIKMFGDTPHWLQGYKEGPQPTVAPSVQGGCEGGVCDFSDIVGQFKDSKEIEAFFAHQEKLKTREELRNRLKQLASQQKKQVGGTTYKVKINKPK